MAKDPNEIGALWRKQGQRGEYFSGTINGEAVVVFSNGYKKEGDRQPDYRVLRATKQAERKPVENHGLGPSELDGDVPF